MARIRKNVNMNFSIDKTKIAMNGDQILRYAGYGFIRDGRTGKESYVRRLTNLHYPRLHMYFDDDGNRIAFNLHLDQKQASYEGHHMHNAEYDGGLVDEEIKRLKQMILSMANRQAIQVKKPEEKKSGWKFWQ